MAISEERLSSLLDYCRLPDADALAPGDAELLEVFYSAAVAYMTEAGVPEPKNDARYDLCVNALVLDMYDNRGSQSTQNLQTYQNPTFRAVLNQLKLDAMVHESDEEG